MNKLSFSIAQSGDSALVAKVLTSATQYKLSHGDTVWGSAGWTEAEAQSAMEKTTTYLIRLDGEAVGTVALQWEDETNWGTQPPNACYIHRLAVKKGFHGRGIGEQIIDWAAKQAANNKRHLLRLDCEAKNTRLCNYYLRLGFIRVGTRPVPKYGDYVAALFERPV